MRPLVSFFAAAGTIACGGALAAGPQCKAESPVRLQLLSAGPAEGVGAWAAYWTVTENIAAPRS